MTRSKPTEILETAVYVDDLDAAARFYGDLLGLEKVIEESGRHVFFRCGQSMLLLFNPRSTDQPLGSTNSVPPHGAKGPGHICFSASSAEIDEYEDRFKTAGVDIEAEIIWPNGARSIYVRDPSGNSIEFAEPELWQV